MTNPDNPLFSASRGFDFEDPSLPDHLIDQLFSPRLGVPEHYLHRQATNVRRASAQRPPVEHHILPNNSQPKA